MVDCSARDVLGTATTAEVYGWYSRLADSVARRPVTGGGPPLSAVFLRRYLAPGSSQLPFVWQAPRYLKHEDCVRRVLEHHRRVYLSIERARPNLRWGGVRPRHSRVPPSAHGYPSPYSMHYESLVEPPEGWSVWGTDDQKDILFALGTGFQLRTEVVVTVRPARRRRRAFDVTFNSVLAMVVDRLPNPDAGSSGPNRICPRRATLTVFHRAPAGRAAADGPGARLLALLARSASGHRRGGSRRIAERWSAPCRPTRIGSPARPVSQLRSVIRVSLKSASAAPAGRRGSRRRRWSR